LAVLDACLSDPCQNGANCTSDGDQLFSCSCAAGFTGHNCETGKYRLNLIYSIHQIGAIAITVVI